MSESGMRSALCNKLRSAGVPTYAVENATHPGYPDVECTLGLIELKHRDEWPKRVTTPVRFKHFTTVQRVFAFERYRKSKDAWVLVRVKRSWFLFDGETAKQWLGYITQGQMREFSVKWWPNGIKVQELIDIMLKKKMEFLNELSIRAKSG